MRHMRRRCGATYLERYKSLVVTYFRRLCIARLLMPAAFAKALEIVSDGRFPAALNYAIDGPMNE